MASAFSQMKRLDELEAHLAVKQRELGTLQKEIAERQAQLEDANDSNHGNDDDSQQQQAKETKKPSSSQHIPSIGQCAVVMKALESREYIEFLPLYEASNASSALRAAVEVEDQQILLLKREIQNLTTEFEQTQIRATKARKEYSDFQRTSGYTESALAAKHPTSKLPPPTKKQQQQNDQENNNNNESSASANNTTTTSTASKNNNKNLNETPAQKGDRVNKELADQYILELRKVEEHLKASRLLQAKFEASLKELSRAGEVQYETETKVALAQNDVLVLDRDIELKQAELLDLRELQGSCDGEMQKIDNRRVKEQQLVELIQNENRKVKSEVGDVTEQRRLWDETVKAQDRRLQELRERKEIIEQSVADHGIKKYVDEYVEQETAERQRRDAETKELAEEDEEGEHRHGVNPAENLSDIISHYADVKMLSPPEEVVANGVVMLLTSLHDKLAHRVRCKEVLLEEKQATADALRDRVAQLLSNHDLSEDKLYVARIECEKEVNSNVDSARQQLSEFRDEFNALKNVSLNRQRKERHESINRNRTAEPLPEMKFREKKAGK